MYRLLLLLLFVLSHAATAANIGGYREAVVVTSDMKTWESYIQLARWELFDEGEVAPEIMASWPDCDAASYQLYRNPGTHSGYLRLVEPGSHCPVMGFHRPNDQTWETGGHFDLNVRVKNLAGLRNGLMNAGWHANADPVRFSFGPFVVSEWIAHGPDGVAIAFIERHAPALEGWPHIKSVSRLFNSTQIVADMTASRNFYESILGFKQYLYTKGASEKPGPNVLGLPDELTTEVEREVIILHPEGVNEGSIELIQFHGASGRDFSIVSEPWRLGLSSLRFPVESIEVVRTRLEEAEWEIAQPIIETELAPYGQVKLIGINTPEGARLEFFEEVP